MDIFNIVTLLSWIKKLWDVTKKHLYRVDDNKTRREQLKRLNANIKRLRFGDKGIQYLAIKELELMSQEKDLCKGFQESICISLCDYLSSHPKSHHAINALFKKGSVFATLNKEINSATFEKIKLSRSHTFENVIFVDCKFLDCCFNNTRFRDCFFSGCEIRSCLFKDKIKFHNCHINDVHLDVLFFRHTDFNSVTIHEGTFSSSTILLSELRGVTFTNVDIETVIFDKCQFQGEDFLQCRMSKVSFVFKNDEEVSLEKMKNNLVNLGHYPHVEGTAMTVG